MGIFRLKNYLLKKSASSKAIKHLYVYFNLHANYVYVINQVSFMLQTPKKSY